MADQQPVTKQNPFNFLSLVSGFVNPAQLGANLAFDYGVKVSEDILVPQAVNAIESIKVGVTKTTENIVSGIKGIGSGIGGALSGAALNIGLYALIVILFIALFFKATNA